MKLKLKPKNLPDLVLMVQSYLDKIIQGILLFSASNLRLSSLCGIRLEAETILI